jgi:NitT/TauT family transport system ATP-binding protein
MAEFAQHYPTQLSVGMRQRVNMARSICVATDILLMDEPFAALDEQTRMVLGEDLSILLAKTGRTIMFVTHSLAEAVFLSDRIAVMTARPGRIKTILEVKEAHPRSPDFMLEPRFSDLRNELYALLRDEILLAVAAQRDLKAPGEMSP